MLTGDENIIDIDLTLLWRIDNAVDYLFNTRDPDVTVKAVAESVLREVMGRTPIQPALGPLRAQIAADVMDQSQKILNTYGAGVQITQVLLQKVDPPDAVIESFRDVQRAKVISAGRLMRPVSADRQGGRVDQAAKIASFAAAGYYPVALDLPGYGGRDPVSAMSFDALAEDVEFAITRGALERPVIVGHSMGGMVVQTMLRRKPDGYVAAVLSCTSPAFGNPSGDFQ